jgi:hypothetical protein
MNIKRIITLNEAIKRLLPKTYPRPKLAFFEDEQHLTEVQGIKEGAFAVYDPNFDTINLPIKDTLALSDIDIAKLLLHEYGHSTAFHKHGSSSKEYSDEVACDQFACRWVKKLDLTSIDNKRFCGWRTEELEYLKANYPTQSKERMIKRLDRTWPAIKAKAHLLGVKRA